MPKDIPCIRICWIFKKQTEMLENGIFAFGIYIGKIEKARVCSRPNADKITPIIAFYAVRKSHVYNSPTPKPTPPYTLI